MRRLLVSIVLVITLCLLFPLSHADNCECETCWSELERIEHMYE